MYEDCACGSPCGMEPMGCASCMSKGNQDMGDWDDLPYDEDDMCDDTDDGEALASAGHGTDEDYYLDSAYEDRYDIGDW